MPSLYNRVAGQSVHRLAALSDGIFAFAMTLLVLDLRVPADEALHSERATVAGPWCTLTAPYYFLDERDDPRHFLGRTADAMQARRAC